MHPHRVTLMIYGASTYLGREIARFGRALGHRIIAIVDGHQPELSDPWMHGVSWVVIDGDDWQTGLAAPLSHHPVAAVLYCDTALYDDRHQRFRQILYDRPRLLIAAAEQQPQRPRFILRSTVAQPLLPSPFTTYARRTEQQLLNSPLVGAIFRLPLLYGPDRPDTVAAMALTRALRCLPWLPTSDPALTPMPVETAALAMLRAALEPDIEGILDPQTIATLGDVMIAQ